MHSPSDLTRRWARSKDAVRGTHIWPRLSARPLNLPHYPVSRAFAHYYPNYEGEVGRFLRMIMRHSKPDWVVVDLGCGSAIFTTPWRQFCRRLIGVDISPRIRENPWVGDRVRGDLYQLPLLGNSVDLVIMRYVLEHLERPVDALREAARVLRPGGKLVLLPPQPTPLCLLGCSHDSSLVSSLVLGQPWPLWRGRLSHKMQSQYSSAPAQDGIASWFLRKGTGVV